ncbi:MAG TPA: virulence factor Mce family protein [Mycobacterium sp.]|nr:virulence factor Mce family protein [Mycobacterium sp.]
MSVADANSRANRRAPRRAVKLARHKGFQSLALLAVALMLSSCGAWRGISNVPMPGSPGTGPGSYTVYVQVPNTLAINGNSKVMVADVYVGTVRAMSIKNWVATLTLGLDKGVKLAKNATAKIGQTNLLGSQHLELRNPPDPSPVLLRNGDTIPLEHSSAYPTVEQTLASLAMVLRGGGIANLEVLQNEVYNIVAGRADQIRDFLGKLDTFTDRLDQQRYDIDRAIDSTDRLLSYVSAHAGVLDRVLTEVPPLLQHFVEKKDLFVGAVESAGRFGQVTDQYLAPARDDLHRNLQSLQCPLKELGRGAPDLYQALTFMFTQPFSVTAVPKAFRGDYFNLSLTLDLTYSAIDNAALTGTGLSGVLRALEQSFGRNPESMIPDIRYTPNPNDVPGGPLVERGDRNC